MIRHTLIPIALCLAMGFGITVLVGCQESSLVGSQSPTTEGIVLNVEDLFEVIDEYLTSEDDMVILTTPRSAKALEGATLAGEIPGGIQFGQFAREGAEFAASALGKAEQDPDCSVPVSGEGRRKFVECVRDIADECPGGVILKREGDNINAYSQC